VRFLRNTTVINKAIIPVIPVNKAIFHGKGAEPVYGRVGVEVPRTWLVGGIVVGAGIVGDGVEVVGITAHPIPCRLTVPSGQYDRALPPEPPEEGGVGGVGGGSGGGGIGQLGPEIASLIIVTSPPIAKALPSKVTLAPE
jgi:hypothetical protein